MNLEKVHDGPMKRNHEDKHRTLEMPVRVGLGGNNSLRFDAKEAKKFPPHILLSDSNDISNIIVNYGTPSTWYVHWT